MTNEERTTYLRQVNGEEVLQGLQSGALSEDDGNEWLVLDHLKNGNDWTDLPLELAPVALERGRITIIASLSAKTLKKGVGNVVKQDMMILGTLQATLLQWKVQHGLCSL